MDSSVIIDRLIDNAKKALDEFKDFSQEQVDACIKAMLLAFKAEAETLSKEVIQETGLGNYQSKLEKNSGSPDAIWYALKGKKSVGVIGEDKAMGLKFVAQPKGILSSVAPTTNPNITVLFNASFALKGRNVLIVAPHPRARRTTLHTVEILNKALKEQGAPDNVIQCIEEPSVELTQLLMKKSNVIIATGGAAMVEAAYSSGRPAFGVGPGNVQTIIDKGFDYAEAAAQIALGRKYDNGLICAGNQSVIMPKEDADKIIEALGKNGVFYVDEPAKIEALRTTLFPDGRHIAGSLVGQSALAVAAAAGVSVPENTEVILIKGDSKKIGKADPLCGEKMCPVLVALTYDSFEEAVDIAKTNLLYEGAGHSAVLHTYDEKKMEYAGVSLPVSRLLINQPGIFAANPALANGFNPTSTLGCGSWGNNSISENLTFEHLINISRIGMLRDPKDVPNIDSIWED